MYKCEGCQIKFTPKRKGQKFHDRNCFLKSSLKLAVCPQCEIKFKKEFSKQICCTPECANVYRAKKQTKGIYIHCSSPYCKKSVYKMQSRISSNNFCDDICRINWLRSDLNTGKHRKHTKEEKDKITLANLNRDYSTLTEKTRQKFRENTLRTIRRSDVIEKTKKINGERMTGSVMLEETKQKIKESSPKGEDNHSWKGDGASYQAKHMWVYLWKGKPLMCVDCGATLDERKIQWSNLDHKYKRELDDYEGRCVPCHRAYDTKIENAAHKVDSSASTPHSPLQPGKRPFNGSFYINSYLLDGVVV